MSYDPVTDFLGLVRQTGAGAQIARMPGLDFLLAAMERAGLISLWTEQSPPVANLASTVWLRPASPSWTAEGVVFLYDADAGVFVTATPALWAALLAAPSDYIYQAVTAASDTVNGLTTLLAVRRTVLAPTITTLLLPALTARAGRALRIVDWSTLAAEHHITMVTPDGATIMRRAAWNLYSTVDQLSGVTLHPSTDLNGWVITP